MKIKFLFQGLLIPLIVLSIWFSLEGSYLLPPPKKIWNSFFILLLNGTLMSHIYFSLSRVIVGFLSAFIVATFIITLFYYFPYLRNFFQPSLDFFRYIPPLAVLSLLILWFGIGEVSKIIIVFMASFFPILLNMESGILNADNKLIEVGKAALFSHKDICIRIILPSSLPSLITGLHLGLTYSWRSLIGAEFVATSSGLGYMILDARELSRPDIIMVGVLAMGLIGALIDLIFMSLIKKLPWLKQGKTYV
ncbi:MAG: ABC transporter permease [Brevinema sp.]